MATRLMPCRPPEQEEPVYWFFLLERARHCGDFATAAAAQEELRRLGVWVRYGRPRRRGKEADPVTS